MRRVDAGTGDIPRQFAGSAGSTAGTGPAGLVNHWIDKPEWDGGRRLLAAYLTFRDQPLVRDVVRRHQERLVGAPGLDLVEPDFLHLTLLGIGFVDNLGEDAVGRTVEAVRAGLRGSSIDVLRTEPPILDHDAVALPVRPVEAIVAVRERIEAAARTVADGELYKLPEPLGGFDPHVSIAYANRAIAASDLLPRLDAEPVAEAFEVGHVSLVELQRAEGRWFWHHETQIVLEGSMAEVSRRA